MRQDSVGANAQVSEEGTRVTGRRPLAPKLEYAREETVERSLFSATLCCSFHSLSDSRWPPKSGPAR